MTTVSHERPGNTYADNKFKNQELDLDNNSFLNCEFEGCILIYSGGPPPSFVGCNFKNTKFMFAGGAANTIQFMVQLYGGMGEGGRQLIEATFRNIKEGKLIAPEVRDERRN